MIWELSARTLRSARRRHAAGSWLVRAPQTVAAGYPLPREAFRPTGLLHIQQLHVEHEPGVAGNRSVWRTHRAVAQIGRDNQPPFAANLHPLEPLVPAANDVTRAEPEGKRFHAHRRVELFALVVGPARIVEP